MTYPTTPNLGLPLVPDGDQSWGPAMRAAMNTLDGAVPMKGRVHVLAATGVLAYNATANLDVDFAESCDLISVTSDHPAWIRVYSSDAARTLDAARAYTDDPTPGQGLMGEVATYAPDYLTIDFSPVPFFNNQDATLAKTAYLAITNMDPAYAGVINLDFMVLPQEQLSPSGPQGGRGLPGVDGNTVLYGTTDPTIATGVDGNFYINTATHTLFGPRAAGVWPAGTSLVGPAGVNGTAGANGTNGVDGNTILYGTVDPTGAVGLDGNFYINTAMHALFGPRAAGVWPAGTSLVGPAGSGVPAGGTTGQALVKLSNTDLDVGWGAGGGGGLVLLEQHTANNSASLDFTTAFTSNYDDYVMELIGIIPATNGAVPYLRCSTNGGSAWDTSSIYTGNELHTGAAGSSSIAYGAQGQWIIFSDNAGSALSSSALPALVGSIHIYDPLSISKHKRFVFGGIGVYSGNGADYLTQSSGKYASTTAVNALRFVLSTGNIASGTIRVYGIAK
ncbi:MAG: hypothetical protein P4L11_13735 [Geothrix sp.]|nr:hypothetical protein [Geothrix sp.]